MSSRVMEAEAPQAEAQAEDNTNKSFDEDEYLATDAASDDGIAMDDDDDPADDASTDSEAGQAASASAIAVPKKPPFRDPPIGQVRLRPSSFRNIPATVFIEYPPELKINKRDDDSYLEDLGKRQLGYMSHWERICIRNAFHRAGFSKVNEKGDKGDKETSSKSSSKTGSWAQPWTAMWSKHQNESQMQGLNCLQKVNHFPSSWCIGRKDRLVRTMQAMYRVHGSQFNFHPASFILPAEREASHRQIAMDTKAAAQRNSKSLSSQNGGMWIIKPCASSCGKGIQVISGTQVLAMPKNRKVLVQKYIHDPMLINNKKFDLRMYVMVTGVDPLRIYIFNEGLARFSTKDYSLKNLGDRFAHLTNYSINKKSKDFKAATEGGDDNGDGETEGFKWSLPAFKRWMAKNVGPEVMKDTMIKINDLLVKTIIAAESTITPQLHSAANYRTNCFELFGCDVMLDSKLVPHLIEVNISPSLAGSSPLDKRIKGTLIADIMHIVGIYPHDPKLLKKFDDVSLPPSARLSKKTKSSAKVSSDNRSGARRPSSAGAVKSSAFSSSGAGSNGNADGPAVNPFAFGSMSKMMQSQDKWRKAPIPANISFEGLNNSKNEAAWMMLLMAEDEFNRCKSTQFVIAHPRSDSAAHYNALYFSSRFSDQLLARWIIDGGSNGPLRKYIPEKFFSDKMREEEAAKISLQRVEKVAQQQAAFYARHTAAHENYARSGGGGGGGSDAGSDGGDTSPPLRSRSNKNMQSRRNMVAASTEPVSQFYRDYDSPRSAYDSPSYKNQSQRGRDRGGDSGSGGRKQQQAQQANSPPYTDTSDNDIYAKEAFERDGDSVQSPTPTNPHNHTADYSGINEELAASHLQAAKREVFSSTEFSKGAGAGVDANLGTGRDLHAYDTSSPTERPMAASGSTRNSLRALTKDEALEVVKHGLLKSSASRRSRSGTGGGGDGYGGDGSMVMQTQILTQQQLYDDMQQQQMQRVQQRIQQQQQDLQQQQQMQTEAEHRHGSHVMTVRAQRQLQKQADQRGDGGGIGSESAPQTPNSGGAGQVAERHPKYRSRSHGATMRDAEGALHRSEHPTRHSSYAAASGQLQQVEARVLAVKDAGSSGVVALPRPPIKGKTKSTKRPSSGRAPMKM